LIGGGAKIFFVIDRRSVIPLGFLTVGQCVLMQGWIMISAIRGRVGVVLTGFSIVYAKDLLRSSLPLMISSIAVFVYLRANIFFLNEYESREDVGIYLAAAALSGSAYLMPSVLVSALAPGLYRLYHEGREQFENRLSLLTNILTLAIYAVALAVTVSSHKIITALYGVKFLHASPVLALHVWTLIPVAYGLTSSIWLAAEKRTSLLMSRTICGGIVNVALNLLLIPRFGIIGAAIATLAAMFMASTFMLAVFGTTGRRILAMQIRALLLIDPVVAVFGRRKVA
jgi:O-antigen/teichoic acid export membrane protein